MDRPLVWLRGEVRTPPFSREARIKAGYLLRRLQKGEIVSMPHSRPIPSIDRRCHELRVQDRDQTWRIVYAIEPDAIVILDVFSKKSNATPQSVIETSKMRLRKFRTVGI